MTAHSKLDKQFPENRCLYPKTKEFCAETVMVSEDYQLPVFWRTTNCILWTTYLKTLLFSSNLGLVSLSEISENFGFNNNKTAAVCCLLSFCTSQSSIDGPFWLSLFCFFFRKPSSSLRCLQNNLSRPCCSFSRVLS